MPTVRSSAAVRFLFCKQCLYHITKDGTCIPKRGLLAEVKVPSGGSAGAVLRAWYSALRDVLAEHFWRLLCHSINCGTVVSSSHGSIFHYVFSTSSNILASLQISTVSCVLPQDDNVLGSGVQTDHATWGHQTWVSGKHHCPVVASQEEENKEKAFEALLPYSRHHLCFSASEGLEVPVHLCPHTSAEQVILCGIPLSLARNFWRGWPLRHSLHHAGFFFSGPGLAKLGGEVVHFKDKLIGI